MSRWFEPTGRPDPDILGEHNELFEPHVRNLQTRMVSFPWLTQVEPM